MQITQGYDILKMFGSFNHISTSICHEKKHFVVINTAVTFFYRITSLHYSFIININFLFYLKYLPGLSAELRY